jgi:hypothetical protein
LPATTCAQLLDAINREIVTNWLMAIRDHLSVNIEIRAGDLMYAPEFAARGGFVRARGYSVDNCRRWTN